MRDRRDDFSWQRFSVSVLRRLGIHPRPAPDGDPREAEPDSWSSRPVAQGEDALSRLLVELETSALAVYARAGLPTRPGHYARAPGDREWQFVAEDLLPSDRWALVHDYPPEQGWRFATLRSMGLYEPGDSPALAAAQVLSECQALRDCPESRLDGTMALLERSIRLGISAAWLSLDGPAMPLVDVAASRAAQSDQGDLFLPPAS